VIIQNIIVNGHNNNLVLNPGVSNSGDIQQRLVYADPSTTSLIPEK
jgi:hypothetical protein